MRLKANENFINFIADKYGKIEQYKLFPVKSYTNRLIVYEIYIENKSKLKFLEKKFIKDEDYPNKREVEIIISKSLTTYGFKTPLIIFEDEKSVVYEFINNESFNPLEIQKELIKILCQIHLFFYKEKLGIPFRDVNVRTKQILQWLKIARNAGLSNLKFSNKLKKILKMRESQYINYTLTLRDCGVHNVIYSRGNIYLIDFERAQYSYFTDDIASLILEEINDLDFIINSFLNCLKTNFIIPNKSIFLTYLLSSLFERSLEIFVYFYRKGLESSITEKYRFNCLKYYKQLMEFPIS